MVLSLENRYLPPSPDYLITLLCHGRLRVQVLHDGLPAARLRVCGGVDLPGVGGNLLGAPQLFGAGKAEQRGGSRFPAAPPLTVPTLAGLWNFLHHLPGEDHGPLRHAGGKHLPLRLSPGGHNNDR